MCIRSSEGRDHRLWKTTDIHMANCISLSSQLLLWTFCGGETCIICNEMYVDLHKLGAMFCIVRQSFSLARLLQWSVAFSWVATPWHIYNATLHVLYEYFVIHVSCIDKIYCRSRNHTNIFAIFLYILFFLPGAGEFCNQPKKDKNIDKWK